MELICWQDAYMGYIVGEARGQQTLFPVALDDLIAGDHFCRVIDGFVGRLDFVALGFERAVAAETGRPGYDPRDLLKLYLYGYLQQVRSSRRLEAECKRNVEVMWLLGRLEPDHKSIAEFRRLHLEGVIAAGAELVRFARSVGLVRGEWVAIDGSKFQAVASARAVAERESMKRYLEAVDRGDEQEQARIDPAAVAAALEKLKQDAEPEASFMRTGGGKLPAYNVQTAVDAEHALIVAHAVTLDAADNRQLEPMAEAARVGVGSPALVNIVADAGYSNGEQASRCEAAGLIPHVPANRGVNNQGDGTLFDRNLFVYQPESDSFLCPAGKTVHRKQLHRADRTVLYQAQAADCGTCSLKPRCTRSPQRMLSRHMDDDALNRMHRRATPELMRLRRSTVEHPFGTLKYAIFGHPRLLLRGLSGTRTKSASESWPTTSNAC
jgi:transposase